MDALRNTLVHAKDWVHAILRRPAVGRALGSFYRDSMPVRGCRIDTASLHGVTKADLFWGFYEGYEIDFVRRFLPNNRDVIELGSSLGVVSSHIAARLDPRCRLIGVEANIALIPLAAKNVRQNSPLIDVTFLHGAIDYASGRETVLFHVGETQWSHVAESGLSVPRLTLSHIIRTHHVGEFTLVCDIEGAELGVLTQDQDALTRCAVVIIELHDTAEVGIDDLIQRFRAIGYALRARSGRFGRGAVCAFFRH